MNDSGKPFGGPASKAAKLEMQDLEKSLSRSEGTVDDVNLASLGLEVEATRDIGTIAIIGAGWNICQSWAGVAATMAISIASGGPVTLIYGILVIFITVGASAATMAEIASVYPTAGGQYHWSSILAPKSVSKAISYGCGAINLLGWVATAAGVCIIPPQLVAGIIAFNNPSYTPKAWHIFLMFQAFNVILMAYNIFLMKRTAWIHDVGFALSIAGFCVIFITCLARSSEKQTSEFVWKTFINNSGWSSDGIVFLTGLTNPNYIYSGIDGAVHLAEECKNAAYAVPRALMSTVIIGFITGFGFVLAMTYSLTDFDAVLSTPTGVPIYEIWHQATHSEAAATAFIVILLVCGCFALVGIQQTSSRLTWSFARDDALVFSRWIGQIHPKLGVPVYALIANSVVIFIIGCIYLGSTTAFNAMIATGLILQQVSYAIPAALLLYRKRSSTFLPASRNFRLGHFGWIANILTVIMAVIVVIFYDFPTVMPVTPNNMNYACAVIGVMMIFSVGNWYGYARTRYHGPRLDD